jgi:hypothetical protein
VFFILVLYAVVVRLRGSIPLRLSQSQTPTLNLDPHGEEQEIQNLSSGMVLLVLLLVLSPELGWPSRNSGWATGCVAEESGFDSRQR